MEDFETGDFTQFDWMHDGTQYWAVSGENPFAGDFSAKSGNISDESSSVLEIELDMMSAGDLHFFNKVSSELDFDFLRFYIDDAKIGEWSGESGWDSAIIHRRSWYTHAQVGL